MFSLFTVIISYTFANDLVCDRKAEYQELTGHYPFELQDLPYTYNYLEPVLSHQVLYAHHDHHHDSYRKKLNNYLEDHIELQEMTLTELQFAAQSDETLQKFAGGYYNHYMYWWVLTNPLCVKEKPGGDLKERIEQDFGSFEEFKVAFKDMSEGVFGSGWSWACVNGLGVIELRKTANQISPLMNVDGDVCYPFLLNDIWEHAYYLHYLWERSDYIDYYWEMVDWELVEMFYEDYAAQLAPVPFE